MSENKNNVIALKAATTASATSKSKPAVHPLIKALKAKALEVGHSETEMAVEVGVTFGYIRQLESGLRQVQTISDEFAAACAKYLSLTRLQVFMLAGRIKPQDFFSDADVFRRDVERAVKFIESDGRWNAVLTEELRASSLETLYGVVRLYEAATGTILMTSRQEGTQA